VLLFRIIAYGHESVLGLRVNYLLLNSMMNVKLFKEGNKWIFNKQLIKKKSFRLKPGT